MNPKKEVTFLIVDDEKIDRQVVKRALRKEKIANPTVEAFDGIDALEKLRGNNGQEKILCPYIILLDLNMPRMDGIEFLHAIRSDDKLKRSIVFILTTSNSDKDKMESYNMNVSGYIVKGEINNGLSRFVLLLDAYWKIVEFPPQIEVCSG